MPFKLLPTYILHMYCRMKSQMKRLILKALCCEHGKHLFQANLNNVFYKHQYINIVTQTHDDCLTFGLNGLSFFPDEKNQLLFCSPPCSWNRFLSSQLTKNNLLPISSFVLVRFYSHCARPQSAIP
jgi:tRNA(Ile2) C34 agmatinyltransferase TiaS